MKSARLLLLIPALVVLCACPTTEAATPDSTVENVNLDSLALTTESYCYVGRKEFWAFRSCRIPRICLKDITSTFNHADSILHVSGTVYDCMHYVDFSEVSLKVIVGPLCQDRSRGTANLGSCISTRINRKSLHREDLKLVRYYSLKKGKQISFDIKVTPGDCLSIVQAEADLGSEFRLMSAAIFEVGKLLQPR